MRVGHSPAFLTNIMALPRSERWLLAETLLVVVPVRAILWLLPSRLTLRLVRRLADAPPRRVSGRRPAVGRVVWAVESVSRRIPHASCLTQAIAAQLVLRHYGYASRLCVGVAKSDDGDFRAHAWLERDGEIVIGGEMSSRLARLPALRSPRTSSARSGAR